MNRWWRDLSATEKAAAVFAAVLLVFYFAAMLWPGWLVR